MKSANRHPLVARRRQQFDRRSTAAMHERLAVRLAASGPNRSVCADEPMLSSGTAKKTMSARVDDLLRMVECRAMVHLTGEPAGRGRERLATAVTG